MRANARAHLDHLLFKQHDINSRIEFIFVGPSGNDIELELFQNAIERVRRLTTLQIRILFGGASVYEAMNIGISHSKGHYIFFCGDTDSPLCDHLLSCIDTCASSCRRTNIRPILLGIVRRSGQLTKAYLPKITGFRLAIERNPTHHQAILYPAQVFHSLGFYSHDYRVLGDYEFHLRLRSRIYMNCPELCFVETNCVFCDFDDGGLSSTGRIGNYIESYNCKKPFLKAYLLPLALAFELFAFSWARIRRFTRIIITDRQAY